MRGKGRRDAIAPFGRIAAIAAVVLIGLVARGDAAEDRSNARALTEAYNASGQELFKLLSLAPGNIVISPYSIGTAMAMALSGARGATEAEMAAVLKHRLPRAAIEDANARVLATLNSYDKSPGRQFCINAELVDGRCVAPRLPDGRCSFPSLMQPEGERCVGQPLSENSAVKLSSANALALPKGGGVSTRYAALLKDKYAAEVLRDAGPAEVNAWVSRKTEGKISRILDDADSISALALLNTTYFKTSWVSMFDKRLTKDAVFSLSRTEQVRVPTMHQELERGTLAWRPGYRAIRLRYGIQSIGMVVVLPDQVDGLADVSNRLEARELSELFAALRGENAIVELALPRFRTQFKAQLMGPFRQSGMSLAFGPQADFSGMTGRPGSSAIGSIVHGAVIDVHERGTEAAAATLVDMKVSSGPTRREVFRVDRPFLYYIVDDTTGAILFQGRVVDPR